jgi:hypothetical protein
MVRNACKAGFLLSESKGIINASVDLVGDIPSDDFVNIAIVTKHFSSKPVFGVRSVVATASAGEAGYEWCVYDSAVTEYGLETSCRGFVLAYTSAEAEQVARTVDDNGGTTKRPCKLRFSASILNQNWYRDQDALFNVPISTKIEEFTSAIEKLMTIGHEISADR